MRFFSGHKWPLPVGKRFWSFTTAQPHCSLSQCCEAPEVWHHCAHPKTSREEGFDEHYDRTLSPIAPLAQASGATWWESDTPGKWQAQLFYNSIIENFLPISHLLKVYPLVAKIRVFLRSPFQSLPVSMCSWFPLFWVSGVHCGWRDGERRILFFLIRKKKMFLHSLRQWNT